MDRRRQSDGNQMVNQAAGHTPQPDPHALAIADAVQRTVSPDTVILFGSRAAGDHREDSDIDLLVVTNRHDPVSSRLEATAAARSFMKDSPPELELGIISMDLDTFQRCRLAKQHVAGQAATHGVVMSGERLDYGNEYEDDYPEHWPETSQRIRRTEEWGRELEEKVDADHWNKSLIGYAAEQMLENALKGWLSAHQDDGRYGHNIEAAWRKLDQLEDWSQSDLERLRAAVQEVFDHTTFSDPGANSPDRTGNWLMMYATIYDYSDPVHEMTREEQRQLADMVTEAVRHILDRIHGISGTGDSDVYPGGRRPWET